MRPPASKLAIALAACMFMAAHSGSTGWAFDESCEYWVAPPPVGDDVNPGTRSDPWASLQHANKSVPDMNCTVWFFPGEYVGGSRLNRRFVTQTTFRSLVPYKAILENDGATVLISGAKNVRVEGFDIRHTGPGATPLLVAIDGSKVGWSEYVTLRDNIIHDSYNNDLLKVYNQSRFITIENNLFYNQGPGEEHMDVNSVTDVVIQDNIFLDDYEDSGRPDDRQGKQFIVIKDSNGAEDGLVGSRRVVVRRNIFLNWEGQDDETFIQVGLDGKPYFEAVNIHIENNLLIGNSDEPVGSAFGVRGAKDVYFVNNTVVGDLPSSAFAMWVTTTEQNPRNEQISFYNNIWSDPTGTMGEDREPGNWRFSRGRPENTNGLRLDNNLYWNAGLEIPSGDLISPEIDDPRRIIDDPRLRNQQSDILLPHWNGSGFPSGNKSIREEFIRLVEDYGAPSMLTPGRDRADITFAPADDILGRPRRGLPDMGAYEHVSESDRDWWLWRNQQEF